MRLPFSGHLVHHLQEIVSIDDLLQVLPDLGKGVQDIAPLGPHQTHSFPIEKDQPEMGKEIEGILKPFLASPCPFCNPFELSEIFGEEGDDLVRLPVIDGIESQSHSL